MKYLKIIIFSLLIGIYGFAYGITPAEVMHKAVKKIGNSNGITGTYTISGSGNQINSTGNFKFNNRKSFIDMAGGGKVWYDGKDMWTLNPKTKEITVTSPDDDEIGEINPLTYILNYTDNYNLFFSKRKESGKYLVLLNPKDKNSDIKAIEIGVNSNTYIPEHVIIRDKKDNRITVGLSNLNYNVKIKDSDFKFPVRDFKEYEVIDLR